MKEIHIIMDEKSREELEDSGVKVINTYCETLNALQDTNTIKVFTTVPHFLNFKYSYLLFVHVNRQYIFIRKGKTFGTKRIITDGTNLEKLLYSGEFSWFKPTLH